MVNVSGQVTDYFTGRPVPDATVIFNTAIATTDVNGNFILQGLPPDAYTITIVHRDYEQTILSSDLRVEQAYAFAPFRIKPIFKVL